MRRFAFSSVIVVLTLVACVGDDPSPESPSSSGGGADGGPSGLGTPCNATTPCANGAVCVDGVCCESACTGVCETCNAEGRCVAASGAPKHGACEGDPNGVCAGTCDGTVRDACKYPDVECGKGSCAAGTATLAARCARGTCPAAATQKCSLGCFEDGCLGVQQVAGGYYHTCAVLTDGKVRCWGANDSGEAGQDASTTTVKTPTEVRGLSNVKGIAATFSTSCALIGDGTVRCWGSNTSGQLGRGGAVDTVPHADSAPVQGIAGATFLRGSSAGHFCAIVAGGQIRCWGDNGSGQLGNGTTSAYSTTPVVVCQPGTGATCTSSSGATFVVGGDSHTCAIFAGDKVACWGNDGQGELGRPTSANDKYPDFVTPAFTAKYLTAGNQATCAVDTAGGVQCWGSNNLGAIGNGTDSGSVPAPTPVCTKQDCSTHLGGSTGVTTFDESSCAISNGAVKCWGTNSGGQLGDGNASASQNYAATSSIPSGAAYVASGGAVHFAIVADGANRDLRCWGGESRYQCGVGTTSEPRKTPVSPTW